ncbi:MAG TPA: serine/threonine-protein kinase [Kofleriaceae bacterium]|nr:serine/threonine-protein kinase [Kofleriaceae bacterium]
MIDRTLSNYKITSKLGEGGMGEVYLAEHVMMGKLAAIKTLRRELCGNPELVNRFFNEARSATMIKHPGIVDIYDFGYHDDGSAYIIMELLEGDDLSARLDGGAQLPMVEVAELGSQIADALAAAHGAGIIHRDLKPDNIFLCPDRAVFGGNRVKLLDFGIAKLTSDRMAVTAKTRTGTVMGTPYYMAPEQCRGASDIDHRVDLYALGCILFEMTCGQVPFTGTGMGELLIAHVTEPPPPVRTLRPDADLAMVQLIERLLSKDRDDRVQRAAEVGDLLRGRRNSIVVREEKNDAPSPAKSVALGTLPPHDDEVMHGRAPRSRRRLWVVLGSAVIALALVLAFASILGDEESDSSAHPSIAREITDAHARSAGAEENPPVHLPVPDAAPPKPTASRVILDLASTPAGAAVYRLADGARIGRTPWHHEYPRSNGALDLVVRLDGYQPQRLSMPLDGDANQTIALKPIEESKPPRRKRRHRPPQQHRDSSDHPSPPVKPHHDWGDLAP